MSSNPPATSRTRTRIGWIVVAVLAVAIAASFALSSGDDAAGGDVRERRATPVAVAAVGRGPLTERGHYPGELDADTADVAAFYGGRLVAVHVRVGDTVEKGDVLAELDPVDAREQIAQARAQATAAAAEARRAEVELDAAAIELARLEPLEKRRLISTQQLDAERARTEGARAAVAAAAARGEEARARVRLLEKRVVESKVKAPFAGRIAERYVDPGAIVAAGARLVRVVERGPLRVRFEVPEHEVAGLALGASLRVTTEAAADVSATAKVTGIASEVSRDRRVATMEAVLDSPPPGWLPGMYAEVVVDRQTINDATIVPATAILDRLQPSGALETGVFVAAGEVARWVPVTIVARDGERVAVSPDKAPLAAGARVLVAGHVDLSDGNPITITRPEAPTPERP